MKRSEIFISTIVFSTFFIFGCLKVGNERATDGNYSNDSSNAVSATQEKNIRAAVSTLHQKYNIRFFIFKTSPFAYKLKVDGDVDINDFVEDLERLELDGEKYLSLLTPGAKTQSFNRKLKEKVIAIRDFLDNYSTDSSYFLKNSGKSCPDISGDYKKVGKGGDEQIISIRSKGCRIFEVSRSKNLGPRIKLEANELCRKGEGYRLCSSGRETATARIEFSFFERWEAQKCTKENWLIVDEKGRGLTSKVRQNCQGASVTVFENKFFKVN